MPKGICADAIWSPGRPEIEDLAPLGVKIVRMQARPSEEFLHYHQRMQESGMWTGVVLDYEAFGGGDYYATARVYAGFVHPNWWFCGNEPDGFLLPDSYSSWSMEPAEFGPFFAACATGILSVQPDAALVIGGMVSGQTYILAEYLDAIRAVYDGPIAGTDAHPYHKDAESARALIREYKAILESYGI